jgi:hypothetical protein
MTDESPTEEQPVACSLTPEEAVERLEWAEDALQSDLRDLRVEDDRIVWTFERTESAIAGVTTLAQREAACCAFATITVTIPPEGEITFRMDVPQGTAEALLTQFSDVGDPTELIED